MRDLSSGFRVFQLILRAWANGRSCTKMATSFTIKWSLRLLILVQACCGDQASLCCRNVAMVYALKQVGQAMQCFGETTQEGLTLQKRSSDQVDKISQMLLDVKNQLDDISQNGTSRDQEIIKLNVLLDRKEQMVNTLTQENTDLKSQLGNQGQKPDVDNCNQTITSLKLQLDSQNQNVNALTQENTYLKSQLGNQGQKAQESQQRIQELEQVIKDLNNTVEAQKPICLTRKCKQLPNLEKIKQSVGNYAIHKNWVFTKAELGLLLDHMGEEYKYLQYVDAHYSISNYGHLQRLGVGSLWHIGTNGYTYLASFLVCAGLPVDTVDSYRMTMLHGAARGGQLDLAKMLVDSGAFVNLKDLYGQTPLIWAAQGGHLDVAQWLIQTGADTTIKDNAQHNALYWARSLNHPSLAEYLEKLP